MGLLIAGDWKTDWYSTKDSNGAFIRPDAAFRNQIGEHNTDYAVEAGRYHLYVSHACPWAHRTLIVRHLKGLEHAIDISVVNAFMGDDGWSFDDGPGVIADTVNHTAFLRDVYRLAKIDYTGRVTVPILWDRKTKGIVNNESSEIIRILNRQFNSIATTADLDLYPEDYRGQIDAVNDWVYPMINNGVYRSGFSTSQNAYEQAVTDVFNGLDRAEAILAKQAYLAGDVITEADWRLWTTLIRFDLVYAVHFKCTIRRIVDYPNLWNYTKQLYQVPGIAERTHFDHIVDHYYRSHPTINPTGIVPVACDADFHAPHDRGAVRFFTS